MSSGAIPASLDIGPAGPGLVAKLLAVEALPWFSYVSYHPVTSVSPCKYGGGGVASLRGPPSSYLSLWWSVSHSSILSSWRPLIPPRLLIAVLPLYTMALPI